MTALRIIPTSTTLSGSPRRYRFVQQGLHIAKDEGVLCVQSLEIYNCTGIIIYPMQLSLQLL